MAQKACTFNIKYGAADGCNKREPYRNNDTIMSSIVSNGHSMPGPQADFLIWIPKLGIVIPK